jgi:hypothetical protein
MTELVAQVLPVCLVAQMQLPPSVETRWQFWGLVAWMIYMTIGKAIVIWQNHQLAKNEEVIKEQTNGLVDKAVVAAALAGEARGEQKGRIEEQARVAAKLALSDEVAAHLEEIRQRDS